MLSNRNRTLFIDRDGVINRRNFDGYITNPADFFFLPNAIKGLLALQQFFNRLIIVTNQQGVAKGIMSENQVAEVHNYMLSEFSKSGIYIDEVLVATNFKGAANDRRKPNAAMALEAQAKFNDIRFESSFMIGDTDTDVQFGRNLGMKTVLIQSKEVTHEVADFVVTDLLDLYYVLEKYFENE